MVILLLPYILYIYSFMICQVFFPAMSRKATLGDGTWALGGLPLVEGRDQACRRTAYLVSGPT